MRKESYGTNRLRLAQDESRTGLQFNLIGKVSRGIEGESHQEAQAEIRIPYCADFGGVDGVGRYIAVEERQPD